MISTVCVDAQYECSILLNNVIVNNITDDITVSGKLENYKSNIWYTPVITILVTDDKTTFINGVGKNGEELISLFDINCIIGEREVV